MIKEITKYVWCSYMCSGLGLQTLYGNMLNDFKNLPTQTDIKNAIIEATNSILKEKEQLPEGLAYSIYSINISSHLSLLPTTLPLRPLLLQGCHSFVRQLFLSTNCGIY